ncbi:TGS-like protein, partial [Baffinella frigidus]
MSECRANQKDNEIVTSLPKIIKTGFNMIIETGFNMVHLIYFFTAGPDEVRGWAAGTIHTDFEKGFICAEVMAFETLRELGTEAEVKLKGKYRQEGKMYVVNDGDVIFF